NHVLVQCPKLHLAYRHGGVQQPRGPSGQAHIAAERYAARRSYSQEEGDDQEYSFVADAEERELSLFSADDDTEWVVDSGCTRHLCRNKELMSNLQPTAKPI